MTALQAAAAAATATLPCQEKVEAPSIVKVMFTNNVDCFYTSLASLGNSSLTLHLASQVMEEDKKKQVLGNGLPTETESPVVAKVK